MRQGSFQSTTLIAGVVLLLILFVSVGYFFQISGIAEDDSASKKLVELRSHADIWQNNSPRSFRYVVERLCTCSVVVTAPYIATEERGNRSATFNVAVESGDGEFLDSPPEPVWVTDIFDKIEAAIELHGETTVDVSYDDTYGYPTRVDIRHLRPETNMNYLIRDFEVLEHR